MMVQQSELERLLQRLRRALRDHPQRTGHPDRAAPVRLVGEPHDITAHRTVHPRDRRKKFPRFAVLRRFQRLLRPVADSRRTEFQHIAPVG